MIMPSAAVGSTSRSPYGNETKGTKMTTFEAILSLVVALVGALSGISQAILHTKMSATQTTVQNIQAATSVAAVATPLISGTLLQAAPLLPVSAQPALTDVQSAL